MLFRQAKTTPLQWLVWELLILGAQPPQNWLWLGPCCMMYGSKSVVRAAGREPARLKVQIALAL